MMGDAFQQNGTTTTTKYDEDDGESSDSEDDDDLADIPDTREYMPLDMEGLKALGIGGGNLRDMPTGGDDEGGYTMEDLQNMTMNNNELLEEEDDEDEDEEDVNDIKLHDGDALVVVAKTEEDFASLEINVFDVQSSNLYVHHDIPLPSFPLCLALGSVVSGYQEDSDVKTGNYVAVGSFEPGIEIWNLDVMNALEPTIVLGGMDTSGAEDDWMKMQMMPTSTTVGSSSGGGKKKKKKKKNAGGADNGDAIPEDAPFKIQLSNKTGLPIGVFDSEHPQGPEEDDYADYDESDTYLSINRGEPRPKQETNMEKKARKLAIKDERKICRMQKKIMKEAFKEEFQKRGMEEVSDAVGGKTVFRFS
mmetsp:Transcript_31029/g.57422  ORF Transcript_31029/g.57422 Transcript_31029/m.57422 type:complete len:362 (-) Transcript_31029:202-1287(-)